MTGRIPLAVALALAAALAPSGLVAQRQQAPVAEVLPDFDTRQSGRAATPMPLTTQAALDRLEAATGAEAHARFDAATGAARLVLARGGGLTRPSADAPGAIARRFLRDHHDLFGLAAGDVGTLVNMREYSSAGEPLTHVFS